MKKTARQWMFAAILTICGSSVGLMSCSDKDDNNTNSNTVETEVAEGSADFVPEKLASRATFYAAPSVDQDLANAFSWATLQTVTSPQNANIILLNKLTDVSEDVLRRAYDSDFTDFLICVVNPVKAELDTYAENHDWIYFDTNNIDDSTLIFGFNAANCNYIVHKSNSASAGDPILANINRTQDYYVLIAGMMIDLDSHMIAGSSDPFNSSSDVDKMEAFANYSHISVTHPYSFNEQFRKLLWSDPDKLSGSGSMTANYDVYMVHVYEGEPGAGDYYGVKMTASVANAGMWKGKGWNRHGGSYVRWCGWWNTDFYVQANLRNANWTDVPDIAFTAGGFPSPATTIGKTEYQDKNSFSLDMSQTVGIEGGKTSKGGASSKDIKGKAELSFSEGWTWEHSETRAISDLDIINETFGNNARWHLTCQNLPKFEWSQDYGFNVTDAKAYRGTISVQGSWLWYDKNGKDNVDRAPYYICTQFQANYAMQSFISTKADLQEKTISTNQSFLSALPKMVNATSGGLKLVNNLQNQAAISNVQVCDAQTGEKYSEFKNTIPNGGEQLLGHFKTGGSYTVKFQARVPGGTVQQYFYTTNPSIEVENKSTTTLYALNDFSTLE